MSSFKDKDSGFDRLRKVFTGDEGYVKVGIVSAKEHGGSEGETVASIAARHELGEGVPERPFMRITMDDNEKNFKASAAKLYRNVMDGTMSEPQALGFLGELIKSKMKSTISDGDKLKPVRVTKKDKGKKTPLIDTDQMITSIDYEVVS